MANFEEVVIGFHESEIEFVLKLAAKMRSSGLSVWHRRPDEGGDKTSEAILGCKVYVPVMTELSAVDKDIHEQLSLAYISNSAIYPLSRIRFRNLAPKLSGGAKLMLVKINWCFVFSDEEFEKKTDALITCIKQDAINISSDGRKADVDFTHASYIATHGLKTRLTHGLDLGDDNELTELAGKVNKVDLTTNSSFWERHFGAQEEVKWSEFREKFLSDYGDKIAEEFPEEPEVRQKFFLNLIFKDVFGALRMAKQSVYQKFCPDSSPHAFFQKMQQYVIAYASLREVLSMDSSLRLSTIQKLGNFSFPAIVSGLSDMLQDEDPNIRTVAAIALAHAGKTREDTIDKLVALAEDEDRLVRESICLSLGYLGNPRAVNYIVDRWRNDPISTVREAAELALSKMEDANARKCMQVTKVLSSEMSFLKPKVDA